MKPLDILRERLEAFEEVLFAYLFGSRARGRPRSDSDWDVAVFLDTDLTALQRFDIQRRLSVELEMLGRVDIVVLNGAPPLLAHRALAGQRLLVRDKAALVRFFVKTMALAEDDRFWSEIHLQARLQRIEEGRFGRPQRL